MGENLTIQERVKLIFMFGKNGANNLHGARFLGHSVYANVCF